MNKKLRNTLEDLRDIVGFGLDPGGLLEKGGGVDTAIDRVVNAGKQVNEEIKGMAEHTIGQTEDLMSADEGSSAANGMILWALVIGGVLIVAVLLVRKWVK